MVAARRLMERQDGAAAIEFGLVLAPFLALLFAILETAIIFFAGQTLEAAAAYGARLIMTGQAQNFGYDQAKFREEICGKIHGLFNCNAELYVDVKKYNSFTGLDTSKPINSNGQMVNNLTYQPGGPGDIVVIRLIYQWPVYISLLGLNLANMSGNKRMLISTVAFRNEPYQ